MKPPPLINKFLARIWELERTPRNEGNHSAFNRSRQNGTRPIIFIGTSLKYASLAAIVLSFLAYVAGYRIATPTDIALLETVRSEIPDADDLPADETRVRLAVHTQAIEALEGLIATPKQENLSDLIKLGSTGDPLILEGRVSAFLSMTRMLGDASPEDQAKLADRVATLFFIAQNDDVMAAIGALADLPTEVRRELVDGRGRGLEALAQMAQVLLQLGDDVQQLSARVEAQKSALQKQAETYKEAAAQLQSQINMDKHANALIELELNQYGQVKRLCGKSYLAYAACFDQAVDESSR